MGRASAHPRGARSRYDPSKLFPRGCGCTFTPLLGALILRGLPRKGLLESGRLPARAEPGAASQRLAGVEQALRGHPGRGSGWLTSMSSCFPSHQPPDHQGRTDTSVEPFEGMKCAVLDLGCSSDGENLACRWPLVLN